MSSPEEVWSWEQFLAYAEQACMLTNTLGESFSLQFPGGELTASFRLVTLRDGRYAATVHREDNEAVRVKGSSAMLSVGGVVDEYVLYQELLMTTV